MTDPKPARVRFAPSPTGRLHIGGARTALYNYLLACQTGGQFILRIEDTDRKRYDPAAEPELIEGLHWLGLEWAEGPDVGGPHAPYRQSERKEIYQKYADRLLENGHAYRCFCTPDRLLELRQAQQRSRQQVRYDGHCRSISADESRARMQAGESHVIRFRTPREGRVTGLDRLRGPITVENRQLDDFILVKSNGLPVYHLAAMVDDHLMEITHVFRAEEWLPTFPLHVLIYQAFGWQQPQWVHLSVFLKPSGKGKMSKRESESMARDGRSIFLSDLGGLGYLPEAVANWLALMGWSYDDRSEFFGMADLIEKFSIERMNPAPASVNFSKLDHFNGLHIRSLSVPDLAMRIRPFFEAEGLQPDQETLLAITPLLQERLKTLDDAVRFAAFFFEENIHPDLPSVLPRKTSLEQALTIAQRSLQILESLPDVHPETTEPPLRELAAELQLKAGQVFGLLRGAITGQMVSPPLFESMAIVGREKVLERVRAAIELLQAAGPA